MATKEELKLALDKAIKDGAPEHELRTLAAQIVALDSKPPQAVSDFSEAERARRGAEAALASPVRVQPKTTTQGGIESVGEPKDFLRGAGRTATTLFGLPGEVVNLIGVDQEGMLMPIPDITQMRGAVETVAGEGAIEGGEDTLMGRSGEFVAGGLIGGAGNFIKAASQAGLKGVGRSLTRNVAASETALAGSEVGGNFFEELGLPRALGNFTGAIVPSFMIRGLNRAVSGGTQQQRVNASLTAKENVSTAKDLSIDISSGVASPLQVFKTMERILASVPGGTSVIHRWARNVVRQTEDALGRITTPVRGGGGPEAAGAGISAAMNRRIQQFQNRSRSLYRAAENAVPPNQPVNPTSYRQALKELAEDTPESLDELAGILRSGRKPISPAARRATDKLLSDRFGGQLSFEEATALRRLIGSEISNSSSLTNPAFGELKRLYGAISDDIGAAMKSPQQQALWRSANNHWKNGRAEIDNVIDKIFGAEGRATGDLSGIFNRLFIGGGGDIRRLRTVWRSMSAEERDLASKAFIARMGRVADDAGQAGRLNPNFKMQTFLNKWTDPKFAAAKDLMFKSQPKFREDMDKFVSYIDNYLETNANLANPSGTAGTGLAAAVTFFGLSALAGAALAPEGQEIEGGAIGIGGMLLAAAGAGSVSRLLTNPKFVNWLANGTTVPVSKTGEYFGHLVAIAQDDPYLGESIADLLNQVAIMTDDSVLASMVDFQGRTITNE